MRVGFITCECLPESWGGFLSHHTPTPLDAEAPVLFAPGPLEGRWSTWSCWDGARHSERLRLTSLAGRRGELSLKGLRAAPRPCRLQGAVLTLSECLVHAALPCGHQVPALWVLCNLLLRAQVPLPSPTGLRGSLPCPHTSLSGVFPRGEAAREQLWRLSHSLSNLVLLLLFGVLHSPLNTCPV